MPSILIPGPLRYYVKNQAEVKVIGGTVDLAIQDLLTQFPEFRQHLCRQDGSLRSYVNLFIHKTNINEIQGMDTPLLEEDVLQLIPSIAGG
jgi:molybdopterin synthase sulfur carrier subunit